MRDNYHVIPNTKEGGWDIKKEDAKRAIRHFNTQKEAIDEARKLSQNAGGELFIHNKNGEILGRDSHGRDPFPPEG
jgi:hypothetical protein